MNVGGYRILRRIGEGAYGKVYLARKGGESGFRTYYALKRLRVERRGDEAFEHYLLREARLGGLVNHPMLVRIHEVLRLDGEYVLVMDYVEGVTLRDVLGRRRGTGEGVGREVALELGADVLDALHYGHTLRDPEGNESGFVHRDVKPGNIMLTPGGSMKLMDFGVARLDDAPSGTQQGELRGTIAYMAPEQASGGETTPAADQFAAALIVLEMLTGDPAWGDLRGAGILARVVAGDVSEGLQKVSVDDPLRPLLERMLATSPLDRFPTAAAAARALRGLRATLATPPALPDFVRDELAWFEANGGGTPPVPSWSGTGGSLDGVHVNIPAVAAPAPEPDDELESLLFEDSLGPGGDDKRIHGARLAIGEGTWSGDAIVDPAGASLREEMPAPLPLSSGEWDTAEELAVSAAREEAEAAGARLGPFASTPGSPAGPDPERTLPIGSHAGVSAAALAAAEAQRAPGRPAVPGSGSLGSLPVAWSEKTLPFTGAAPPPAPAPAPAPGPVGAAPPLPDLPRRPAATLDLAGSPLLSSAIGGLLVCLVFLLAWLLLRERADPSAEARATPTDAEILAARDAPRIPPPSPTPAAAESPPPQPELDDGELAELDGGDVDDPGAAPAPPDVVPSRAPTAGGSAAAALGSERRFVEDASVDVPPEEREQVVVVEATPPPVDAPRPGDVVGERDPLAREPRGSDPRRTTEEKEAAAEADRRAAEEAARLAGRGPLGAATVGVPAAEQAEGPSLRFLSSAEQPLAVPLSLRVRPDGFRAESVSVYYQWRSEGSSGRRKRSLGRQADGSYALEISTSELRPDRLQLWFVAEPGGVDLASADRPLEVRVR